MKTFSVREILEYAIRIETESFAFYSHAAGIIDDKDVHALLTQLGTEEVGHQNRLKKLIDEAVVSPEQLKKTIDIDTTVMDRIVGTKEISGDAAAMDVLKVALERELNTEQTYAMLMSMTQMEEDVLEAFSDLRKQEEGHAAKIRKRIEKLRN